MTSTKNLSPKQTLALAHLLAGTSIQDTAQKMGISTQSIDNWLRLPIFRDRLNEEKEKIFQATILRLSSLATKALDTLENLLDSDNTPANVRCNAAKVVIENTARFRGIDIEDRLQVLEGKLQNETAKGD